MGAHGTRERLCSTRPTMTKGNETNEGYPGPRPKFSWFWYRALGWPEQPVRHSCGGQTPGVSTVWIFRALFFPLLFLIWCVEEITGQGRWRRGRRRMMLEGRPPLSDDEFLTAINVDPGEANLWLAVRAAIAESIDLPAEAVYPDDRMADIRRLHSFGPDK